MNKKTNKLIKVITTLLVIFYIIGLYCNLEDKDTNHKIYYEISNIPIYNGEIYIEMNNNIPEFSNEDFYIEKDYYSELENGKIRNGNGKD